MKDLLLIDRNYISRIIFNSLLVSFAIAGCGKQEAPQVQTAKPQQEMRTRDPAAFVDANFLNEQIVKRGTLRKQLDSLRTSSVIDRKQISMLINRRKGELMALKKNLRISEYLTPAQRDSLIAPLEEEAIELSGDLIAVSK